MIYLAFIVVVLMLFKRTSIIRDAIQNCVEPPEASDHSKSIFLISLTYIFYYYFGF